MLEVVGPVHEARMEGSLDKGGLDKVVIADHLGRVVIADLADEVVDLVEAAVVQDGVVIACLAEGVREVISLVDRGEVRIAGHP